MLDVPARRAPAPPTPSLSGLLRRRLPVVLGLLISGLFSWLFVRSLQLETLAALPARINYGLVAFATGIFLLEFLLRALRWRLLLSPLCSAGAGQLLVITFIGFMANNLLPARAGELVRPVMASRRLELPLAPVLVTTVMERVFDLVGLLSVFVLMTLILPGAGAYGLDPLFLARLQEAGFIFGGLGILGMATLFFLAAREQWARRLVERLSSPLPAPVARLGLRVFDGLATGLHTFRSFTGPLLAVLLSIISWMNGAFAIWIMIRAFGFDLPFAAACFQSVTLALAVILPQAPGFIGVWQVAVSQTLMAWGIPTGEAQGFALLFWLVSFIPVTAIGLGLLWLEGLKLRHLWSDPGFRREPEPGDGVAPACGAESARKV